jgi:hypothetical protein
MLRALADRRFEKPPGRTRHVSKRQALVWIYVPLRIGLQHYLVSLRNPHRRVCRLAVPVLRTVEAARLFRVRFSQHRRQTLLSSLSRLLDTHLAGCLTYSLLCHRKILIWHRAFSSGSLREPCRPFPGTVHCASLHPVRYASFRQRARALTPSTKLPLAAWWSSPFITHHCTSRVCQTPAHPNDGIPLAHSHLRQGRRLSCADTAIELPAHFETNPDYPESTTPRPIRSRSTCPGTPQPRFIADSDALR